MDELTTRFAASFVTEIFKEFVKGGKWLSSLISNKSHAADILGRAAAKYRANLAERYDVMRIFGMAKPVPLSNIYIRVNILEKITSRQQKSISELSEIFDRHQQRFGLVSATKPGMEVVESQDSFILLGRPGSGKTTFLKHILLEALAGNILIKKLPVFLSLKDLSDSGMSLLDRMAREFELSGVPSASLFLESLLEKGKCILLLDGLDEVSRERQDRIISEIKDISDQYRRNQYILSCRVAAYNFWFTRFTDVEIADFGPDEVKMYVKNWFSEDAAKAKSCWEAIQKSPNLNELTSTPLLLAMLCLAYDENMDFGSNRTEIYRDSIEALLKKWDKSRGINREKIYENLTVKRKEEMLSIIAATTFEGEEYFFSRGRVTGLIRDFISNLPEVREGAAQEDAGAVLTSIEEQHGLIVERASKVFSFSHLTFHEYLTASYVVSAGRESQGNLVSLHLDNIRWREVIVMVANLLPNAEDFMMMILKQLTSLGFDNKYLLTLKPSAQAKDKIIATLANKEALASNRDWDQEKKRNLDLVNFINNWKESVTSGRGILRSCFLEYVNKIEKVLLIVRAFEEFSFEVPKLRSFLDEISEALSRAGDDLLQAYASIDQVAQITPDWELDLGDTLSARGYSIFNTGIKPDYGQARRLLSGMKAIPNLSKDNLVRDIKDLLRKEASAGGRGARELQLFVVAETVMEIIISPIYIKKEIRDAVMFTITSPYVSFRSSKSPVNYAPWMIKS